MPNESGDARPFFSILTATYQAQSTIAHLCASIRAQEFRDFEWIVQDNCSTDGTLSYLRQQEIPGLRLESKKDVGIYDALNTAVDRSRGRYLIFLGADDALASPDVLGCAARQLEPDALDVLIGVAKVGETASFRSTLGPRILFYNSVHHQAAFYARGLFDRFRYSLDFRIVADYELNLRLYLNKARYGVMDRVISRCGDQGVSQRAGVLASHGDFHRIRSRYMSPILSRGLEVVGIANALRHKLVRGAPDRPSAVRSD